MIGLGITSTCQHVDSTSVTFLQLAHPVKHHGVSPVGGFQVGLKQPFRNPLVFGQKQENNLRKTAHKPDVNKKHCANPQKHILKHLAPTLVGQESVIFLHLKKPQNKQLC